MNFERKRTLVKCHVNRCVHHGEGEECMLNDILVNNGMDSCSICQDFRDKSETSNF